MRELAKLLKIARALIAPGLLVISVSRHGYKNTQNSCRTATDFCSAPVVLPHERRGEGSEQLIRVQRPPKLGPNPDSQPSTHPRGLPSRAIPALINAYRNGNQSVYGVERPKERKAMARTLNPDTAR